MSYWITTMIIMEWLYNWLFSSRHSAKKKPKSWPICQGEFVYILLHPHSSKTHSLSCICMFGPVTILVNKCFFSRGRAWKWSSLHDTIVNINKANKWLYKTAFVGCGQQRSLMLLAGFRLPGNLLVWEREENWVLQGWFNHRRAQVWGLLWIVRTWREEFKVTLGVKLTICFIRL